MLTGDDRSALAFSDNMSRSAAAMVTIQGKAPVSVHASEETLKPQPKCASNYCKPQLCPNCAQYHIILATATWRPQRGQSCAVSLNSGVSSVSPNVMAPTSHATAPLAGLRHLGLKLGLSTFRHSAATSMSHTIHTGSVCDHATRHQLRQIGVPQTVAEADALAYILRSQDVSQDALPGYLRSQGALPGCVPW